MYNISEFILENESSNDLLIMAEWAGCQKIGVFCLLPEDT